MRPSITEAQMTKEIELARELRRVAEEQEDSRRSLRKLEESEEAIREANWYEQQYYQSLFETWQESDSMKYLTEIEAAFQEAKQDVQQLLDERQDTLQLQIQQQAEKEAVLYQEKRKLFSQEVSDEH